jgi:hypothetical protein
VSTLGALTTNLIPPKVEALNLSITIPYTYLYNQQLLTQGKVSSLIYNLSLNTIFTPQTYLWFIVLIAVITVLGLYFIGVLERE